MKNLYLIISSKKKYLIFLSLILIAGLFLLWQRNGRLGSSRCKNLGSLEDTIGGSRYTYKIYEQGVCYKEDCVVYDNPDRAWCELKGFRKIEGADPNTFMPLPNSYSTAIDKNGFYLEGNRLPHINPYSLSHYSATLLGYCDSSQKDMEAKSGNEDKIDAMRKLCVDIKRIFNESLNKVE